MKPKLIIIAGAIMLVIAAVWYFGYVVENYEIRDYFTDSTAEGKMVFMFIEMDDYDLPEMKSISKELMTGHDAMIMEDTSAILVLIAHFFVENDTSVIPEPLKNQMRIRYPRKKGLVNKVSYIENGYIFTGFSRKVKGLDIPQDSLFKMPFIIPKKGIRAKDVISGKRSLIN